MTIIWAGLSLGAVYALIAVGYNISHLTSGILNFAFANLVTVGMFVAYWGRVQHDYPIAVVFAVSIVLVTALAMLEYELTIRPLRALGGHGELVTVIGAATIITGLLQIKFGSDAVAVPFFGSDRPLTVFGGRVQPIDFIVMFTAIVLCLLLHVVARRSMIGLGALARSSDEEAAQLRGVETGRLSRAGFALSGVLAGVLGPLIVAKTQASAGQILEIAILSFVVLVLGGVGSFLGSLIGAAVIGLAGALAARYIGAEYQDMAVFGVFILVLMLRPRGIFGERRVRAV